VASHRWWQIEHENDWTTASLCISTTSCDPHLGQLSRLSGSCTSGAEGFGFG
jgi:hypothetical protein